MGKRWKLERINGRYYVTLDGLKVFEPVWNIRMSEVDRAIRKLNQEDR